MEMFEGLAVELPPSVLQGEAFSGIEADAKHDLQLQVGLISRCPVSDPVSQALITPRAKIVHTTSRGASGRKTPRKKSWHEIPVVNDLDATTDELKAIKLRGYASARSEYNASAEALPTAFHVGRIVEGGVVPVGSGRESWAAGVPKKKRKQGHSFLSDLMSSSGFDFSAEPAEEKKRKKRRGRKPT